jgi:hypothetical protein
MWKLGSNVNKYGGFKKYFYIMQTQVNISCIYTQDIEYFRYRTVQHRGKTSAHAWGTKKMARNLNAKL